MRVKMLLGPRKLWPLFVTAWLYGQLSTAVAFAETSTSVKPVVSVLLSHVSERSGSQRTVTFAQPFVAGDLPAGDTLQAIVDGKRWPTQIDWKASNNDGSRRHGIITITVPESVESKPVQVGFYAQPETAESRRERAVKPPRDIDARIVLNIGDKSYSATWRDLLDSGIDRQWLSGPLVNEWHVSGPVTSEQGLAHDRIWVQFYVRRYTASGRTRIVTVVENTWAFKANPRNVAYDARLFVNDKEVYSKKDLGHRDHARWRKTFWIGSKPQMYIRHDLNYLKATGTIPNYDPDLRAPESVVSKLYRQYRNSENGPMGTSIVHKGMSDTGGRRDIGPLPVWTVLRLLTMDPRLITVDRGVSESAGSWPIHLRDEATGLPVSLVDHPKLSTHPNLLKRKDNPLPQADYGEYPDKLHVNVSHEPSFAFVPYLLSGDFYFLEELQFWAAMNPLRTSPAYRGFSKGLFHWLQIRGQAWSMRTLGQVAYVTPDHNPMKRYWERQLENNLEWYNVHYANNPDANALGFLGGEVVYTDAKGVRRGIAPWQDDFFTWAMGYLVNLGFENARPMLEYKAGFPVGRMIAPGFCWVEASTYKLMVRDSKDGPFYKSFAQAYNASVPAKRRQTECGSNSMAHSLGKAYKAGDMYGYPRSPQGFPANMQPGLAAAVDAGVPKADEAWDIFMDRATKPNYNSYPNWAIVPRAANLSGHSSVDTKQ